MKIWLRTCPHCDKAIPIEEKDLKLIVRCPNCGKHSKVKDEEEPKDEGCHCGMHCECDPLKGCK